MKANTYYYKITKVVNLKQVLTILPFHSGYRSTDLAEVNAKKYHLKIKNIVYLSWEGFSSRLFLFVKN